MEHSIAQPNVPWDGFKFYAYGLNSSKYWNLTLVKKIRHGNEEGVEHLASTTFGQALHDFTDPAFSIGEFENLTGASGETINLVGSSFHVSMFFMLLSLLRDGYEGLQCTFYFYDHDEVLDDPHSSYAFFVAVGSKIVRERVVFHDHSNSGFDPAIFVENDSEPVWSNDTEWEEAQTHLMYRKFYEETHTGQLMILRKDKPEIYGGRDNPDLPLQAATRLVKQLSGISLALWILVVLVAVMLYRQWH